MTVLAAALGNIFIIVGAALLSLAPHSPGDVGPKAGWGGVANNGNPNWQGRLRQDEQQIFCGQSENWEEVGEQNVHLSRTQLKGSREYRKWLGQLGQDEQQITCEESENCEEVGEQNIHLTAAQQKAHRISVKRTPTEKRNWEKRLKQNAGETTCEDIQNQHSGFECVDNPEDSNKCDCTAPLSDKEEDNAEEQDGEQNIDVERMAPALKKVPFPFCLAQRNGCKKLRASYRPRLSWSCNLDACGNYCITKFGDSSSGECQRSICVCSLPK